MASAESAQPGKRMLTFLAVASFLIPVISVFSGVFMAGIMPGIALVAGLGLLAERPLILPRFDKYFRWLLVAFLGWALLSVSWSMIPVRSLDIWARITVLTLLGLGLVTYVRAMQFHHTRLLAGCLLGGLIVASLLALQEVFYAQGLIHWAIVDVYGRDHFTLEDLNRGACILALMVWPGVLAARTLGLGRWAWLLPVMVLALLTMLESLAAVLSLGISIAVWGLMHVRAREGMRLVVWGVPALFLLWPAVIGSVDWPAKLNNGLGNLPESAKHRIMIWDFTFDRIVEKPVIGWGMDSARKIPGGTASFKEGEVYLPLHPHNIVLQVMLELGAIGWLLLVGLTWSILHGIARSHMDPYGKKVMLILVLTYAGIAMPAFGVWQSWWMGIAWLSGAWALMLMASPKSVA